jgi:hypothetical protein
MGAHTHRCVRSGQAGVQRTGAVARQRSRRIRAPCDARHPGCHPHAGGRQGIRERSLADAYEKLVDGLLASPHHGERLARRWLDLARYADSTGFQNDKTRPNLWRYRDYVINAFNQDKPYDQFVKEQLAGDELGPDNQGGAHRHRLPGRLPRQLQLARPAAAQVPDHHRHDRHRRRRCSWPDVGCARCHDHKFDKISQKEYFQLQAFFANTSEVNDIPPIRAGRTGARVRGAQAKYREATKDIRDQQKAILEPIREAALKYHKERYLTDSQVSLFKPESEWTPLDRWVNHRLANVTPRTTMSATSGTSVRTRTTPSYTEENGERWRSTGSSSEQLKKFDKLKPRATARTRSPR